MISLATISLLGSFAASDFSKYSIEPWSDIRPSWSDPLMDSLKPGGSVAMFTERRLPDGTVSGRDTMRTESVPAGNYSRSIGWYYKKDTTRHVEDAWWSGEGKIDSMTQESFVGDSSTYWLQIGKRKIPGGEVRWCDYGPKRTSHLRIDSFYTFFDVEGRIVAKRTYRRIQATSANDAPYDQFGSLHTDSILWNGEGKPVRWRTYDSSRSSMSSPFSVRRSEHFLTWDGFHLIRDSSVTWPSIHPDSAEFDTSTITYSWDGTRLLGYATWNAQGLPLSRRGSYLTLWSWDSLGRMTRLREWGTETDLDSLFYAGNASLPERRNSYTCSNKTPYTYDTSTHEAIPTKDECSLKETILYNYVIGASSRAAPGARVRTGFRIHRGTLVFDALGPQAVLAVLSDPSGRILSQSRVERGGASLGLPFRGGVAIWNVLDGSGRRIASGTVVVPGHR